MDDELDNMLENMQLALRHMGEIDPESPLLEEYRFSIPKWPLPGENQHNQHNQHNWEYWYSEIPFMPVMIVPLIVRMIGSIVWSAATLYV